jgi:hypothetical protein
LKENYKKNNSLKVVEKKQPPIKIGLEDHKEEETTKGGRDLRENQMVLVEIHKLLIFKPQFFT